jgi:hypothetical protein
MAIGEPEKQKMQPSKFFTLKTPFCNFLTGRDCEIVKGTSVVKIFVFSSSNSGIFDYIMRNPAISGEHHEALYLRYNEYSC